MLTKETAIELLKRDVTPALGCTEPVCVALCAANAGTLLETPVDRIEVAVNAGIYKNGMSAGIPHCSHVGLEYAAALGTFLRNPEKQLELLADSTPEILEQAERLCAEQRVSVKIQPEMHGLYVKCTLFSGEEKSVCVIQDAHTNTVLLQKNQETVFAQEQEHGTAANDPFVEALKGMTIAQMRAVVDTASEEELAFLLDGVEMNETLAAYSETVPTGVGLAAAFRETLHTDLLADDLATRILVQVSSAAESRLDGCPLPTMSSSGAGTKGLAVILPVSETAKACGVSREKTVRAIALAHLVNRYINAYIGKLSPMCSCVMAASTAASVGMTYLLGGTDEQLGYAVRNMTGTVTGMICDGGKVGCALKVASGSISALLCALAAIHRAPLRVSDGICAETPEDCIRNMAQIGSRGMAQTDREILQIMMQKQPGTSGRQ